MFDRNKSGDYVTRSEAQSYIADLRREAGNAFVSHQDAATYSRALNALEERVQELENLASQLRGSGPAREHVAQTAARMTGATVGVLTKSDAEQALAQLKREGAEQFRQLSAKIDTAVHEFVQGEYSHSTTQAAVQTGESRIDQRFTLDYGAVAFGLSQIKRDVANVVGSEVRSADLTEHYRQTVQYFADVFAKSDPEFDADLFKQQAGVV